MINEGDIIEVVVTGITSYGIFVKTLDNQYTGLIHISAISNHFVKDLNDYVKLNEHILGEVAEVDEENKKLKISIKNINYKLIPRFGKIRDTRTGFKALQMHLPVWIREKIKELDS